MINVQGRLLHDGMLHKSVALHWCSVPVVAHDAVPNLDKQIITFDVAAFVNYHRQCKSWGQRGMFTLFGNNTDTLFGSNVKDILIKVISSIFQWKHCTQTFSFKYGWRRLKWVTQCFKLQSLMCLSNLHDGSLCRHL